MKKICLIIFLASLVSIVNAQNISRDLNLPPFDAIHVSDLINVEIIANQAQQQVHISGSKALVSEIIAKVQGHELQLYTKAHPLITHELTHSSDWVKVEISVPTITKIIHGGSGSFTLNNLHNQSLWIKKLGSGRLQISGKNICLEQLINRGSGEIEISGINSSDTFLENSGDGSIHLNGKIGLRNLDASGKGNIYIDKVIASPNLSLHYHGYGDITLNGTINLSQLDYDGSGKLQIYWIDSPDLRISAYGDGVISLAGIAKVVDANVHGSTHLDLRYIRAKSVFVKTYDYSIADVWAEYNLFALADNVSDIYYYRKPYYFLQLIRQDGSVLPMHDIPGAIVHFDPTLN